MGTQFITSASLVSSNGAALIAMAIICKLIRSSYLNLSYILVIETFVKDKLFKSSGKYDSIPRW